MNDGTLIEEVPFVVVGSSPSVDDVARDDGSAGLTANDVGLQSGGIIMEAMPLSSDSWLSRRRWLSYLGVRGTFCSPYCLR